MADSQTQNPASPIATQETVQEIARRCMLEGVSLKPGESIHLHGIELAFQAALRAERSSAERRNEELVRERDEAWTILDIVLGPDIETLSDAWAALDAKVAPLKSALASLTGQVGEMREENAALRSDVAEAKGAVESAERDAHRARHLLRIRDRQDQTHRKFLMRDMEEALAGDLRALRNRLGLMKEGPVNIVQSSALAPSPPSTTGGDGWMPIETAPKNETPVLVFCPSYYQGTGGISWAVFVQGRWLDSRAFPTEPTHWRPLPCPPGEPEA